MNKMTKVYSNKIILAWSLYDWASSAFPVIIITFVFATYFTNRIAVNEIVGTYQWASATALAGIIIAILSPIFGAIADYSGKHKLWLFVLTSLCVVTTALLWFALPRAEYSFYALCLVVIGTITLELAMVFYNAFLPHIAPQSYLGRISGFAWGLGYFGGIVALSILLFVFINLKPSWLNVETDAQIRICGPLTAIWFAIFSLPLFICVPDTPSNQLSFKKAIRRGCYELFITVRSLPQHKNILMFLLAHLIYIDGLNTLFAFAGIYAAGTFHMSFSEIIVFGITMNVSAGLGAIGLGWVDDYWGSKKTIIISLVGLILFGITVLLVRDSKLFWVMGLLLSLFLGPLQSASRSLFVRLIPPEKATEFFGFYAFSGKITAFIGPWLLGMITLVFQSQRAGMAVIVVFFALGIFLMKFVREGV